VVKGVHHIAMLKRLILILFAAVLPLGNLAAAESVTLQLKWKHQFQFAGYYMALEKGFYKDAGFDVKLKENEMGKAPIQQLVSGKADYAVVDSGALLAYAAGAPIKVMAAIFQHSPLALIVTDPDIRKITDLRGKRIMMAPGLNADISAALATVGIGPEDFIRQDISFDIHDLIDGKTDAYVVYITDQPYQLKALGVPYRLFLPRSQDIDFYGDILITTDKTIQENHEKAMAFTEASLLGWEYALGHIDETLDVIEEKYNSQKLSREQLRFEAVKTKEMILGDVVELGYMSDKRWNHIASVYKAEGLLPFDFDMNGFIHHHEDGFLTTFGKFRWQIGSVLLVSFGLLLFLYNLRLRHVVRQRTSMLTELNVKLQHLSSQDSLTGIANRRMFDQALSNEWNRALRNKDTLSLIMIDIDFFKNFNDCYGHQKGDDCLRQVATCLSSVCKRAEDTVARYGGEEFVILLYGTNLEHATELAEKCRTTVESLQLPHDQSKAASMVTISLGVSTITTDTDADPREFIEAADKNLYLAKALGRNQVVFEQGEERRKGPSPSSAVDI